MNSTVRPIFNEKVVEKGVCGSRKQCTSVLFIGEKSTTSAEKKKKKREREREKTRKDADTISWIQTDTNN